MWVRLQPNAFRIDSANPVGLKPDPQDRSLTHKTSDASCMWVRLQPNAFRIDSANPVGLKPDLQVPGDGIRSAATGDTAAIAN